QAHHELLALGEPCDRLRHEIDALPGQQGAERVDLVRLERVVEIQALLTGPETDVLEAEQHHVPDASDERVVVLEREPELSGHLLLARRPAERALETARDFLDEARLLAHAARHPVERAEMVEDRAPDTELRI